MSKVIPFRNYQLDLPPALTDAERLAYEAGWNAGRDAEASGTGIGGAGVRFAVAGLPAPKGSHKLVRFAKGGRKLAEPILVADNDHEIRRWEKAVRTAAAFVMEGRAPFAVPVVLRIVFYMPRPKKPKFKRAPGVKPDWDKLSRSTCDGMNEVVWVDDALVVETRISKRFDTGKGTGAWIAVEELA